MAKLTKAQILATRAVTHLAIAAHIQQGMSLKRVAEKFNVSTMCVRRACKKHNVAIKGTEKLKIKQVKKIINELKGVSDEEVDIVGPIEEGTGEPETFSP